MRVFVQVQETELTSTFKELETHLRKAELNATRLQTEAAVVDGVASFKQTMETENDNLVFVIEVNLENEKQMRAKVAEKAAELKEAIREYEKVLIKKMTLAPAETQDQ